MNHTRERQCNCILLQIGFHMFYYHYHQGGKNTTARVPGGARIELRAPLKKYPGARQVPENLGQKSGDQGSCIWTWRPSQLS